MNCLAGYSPERILPVLYQFSLADYALPSCQMVHLLLSSFFVFFGDTYRLRPLCYSKRARTHTRIVLIYAFVDSFVFQIIVPVLVVHVWCAYMFDIHRAEVHVLDPAYDSARFQAHQDIYKILLGAFHNCLVSFYEGWLLNPVETWKLMYPLLILDGIGRYV